MSSENPDRISLLSDDILHSILSFVPETSEKARTSILSKRFRYLWAHHPSIRLRHASVLLSPADPKSARYDRCVDRCIASYLSPLLRSLDLRIFSSLSASRWLCFAASRSVTDLSLKGPLSPIVDIPVPIFSCRALVSLKLSRLQFPPVDHSFSGFPSLASLTFSYGGIDDATLGSLLAGCPSLTTLKLRFCSNVTTLQLSSAKLARLKVVRCPLLQVSVDAPNLTSITFHGNVRKLCLKSTGPLLLKANIRHDYSSMHKDSKTAVRWMRPVVSLSHKSTNPTAIDWLFNNMFPECLLPLFKNPKVLHHDLLWVTPPLLTGLASMLQHYPNLERLHIDLSCEIRESVMLSKQILLLKNMGQGKAREYTDRIAKFEQKCKRAEGREVWDTSKHMGNSLDGLPCLKTISVKAFVGTPNEMKMLEYLLGMSKCLEKLTIQDCMRRDDVEIHRLLAYIPRASSHVRICVE